MYTTPSPSGAGSIGLSLPREKKLEISLFSKTFTYDLSAFLICSSLRFSSINEL